MTLNTQKSFELIFKTPKRHFYFTSFQSLQKSSLKTSKKKSLKPFKSSNNVYRRWRRIKAYKHKTHTIPSYSSSIPSLFLSIRCWQFLQLSDTRQHPCIVVICQWNCEEIMAQNEEGSLGLNKTGTDILCMVHVRNF